MSVDMQILPSSSLIPVQSCLDRKCLFYGEFILVEKEIKLEWLTDRRVLA
jgi:hypothetical protein